MKRLLLDSPYYANWKKNIPISRILQFTLIVASS